MPATELRSAYQLFTAMGAAAFAERARRELVGRRRRYSAAARRHGRTP